MPGETAVLVVTTLVCFFISHARLRVRLHPRHSLRPLFLWANIHAQLGRERAAGMRSCVHRVWWAKRKRAHHYPRAKGAHGANAPLPTLQRSEEPCGDYFVFPSASYCEMKAQRSPASFSFLMPAKDILVPGIFALGSLMYSLNTVSFQVMPEFLLASE